LSVSCACTQSTPSFDEKRATRPSSIETIATCGRGSAIRARPSSATSRPSPTCTEITQTPSTSAKLVNETPAANQNEPRAIGNVVPSAISSAIGSPLGFAAGSSALISGYWSKCESSDGSTSRRLMPRPPPMPVRKNAGGPPIGPLTAPKAKNDANFSPLTTPWP
jgi:hypothetical protein